MFTDVPMSCASASPGVNSREQEIIQSLPHEWNWRRPERSVGAASEGIAISRWTDARDKTRHAEATTPADRYFIGITLKSTRLKLTRGTRSYSKASCLRERCM